MLGLRLLLLLLLAPPPDLLLGSYVDLHGRSLSVLVQRSVGSTNWLHAQPPRAPRPVCDLLLERLGRCEAELMRLVDTSGRSGGPGGCGSGEEEVEDEG
jgi:hypothetical protein